MAFNTMLADRVREFLAAIPGIDIEEKKMFSGMAFMVNGKMCVNVAGERLMCRFDPAMQEEVTARQGFETMVMRGKELNGYCYVNEDGFRTRKDFEFWINLCLDFNSKAKASPTSKTAIKKRGAIKSKTSSKAKSSTKSTLAIKSKSATKPKAAIKSKSSSSTKPAAAKKVAKKVKQKK